MEKLLKELYSLETTSDYIKNYSLVIKVFRKHINNKEVSGYFKYTKSSPIDNWIFVPILNIVTEMKSCDYNYETCLKLMDTIFNKPCYLSFIKSI